MGRKANRKHVKTINGYFVLLCFWQKQNFVLLFYVRTCACERRAGFTDFRTVCVRMCAMGVHYVRGGVARAWGAHIFSHVRICARCMCVVVVGLAVVPWSLSSWTTSLYYIALDT